MLWLHHESVQSARLRDIKRQIEREKKHAAELHDHITEFLSIAAHQFRTPLSVIKGYTELIEDGAYGKPSKKMIKTLHEIDIANDRLVDIVDEFLNMTHIEQHAVVYEFDRVNVCDLLKQVRTESKVAVEDKGLKIVVTRCKPVYADIDEEKIHHVLTNLVNNAIDYSSKGTIRLTVENNKKDIILRVADQGVGFEPELADKIFGRFYRGDNVKNIAVAGTGLGLFICSEFVKAHGGDIWAESDGSGKGATFSIRLPKKH